MFEINVNLNTFANIVYNAFYVPGTIVVLILNRVFAHKYHTNRAQRLFYTAVMIVFGFVGSHIGADAYDWFQLRRGRPATANRTVFGTIILDLILFTVFAFAEKGIRALVRKRTGKPIPDVNPLDIYDMLQPGAMILIILTKVRCLWVGCCYGIPWSLGVYNDRLDTKVFPVRTTEALMTFCIFLACYFITQTRFFRRGMALFIGVGAFAFGRFFLEYLMYYAPEDRTYLGIFTFYQCLCILIFSVCLAVVIVLYKVRPSDPLPGKMRPVFEAREKKRDEHPRKQTVSQKKYSKNWQSTKKKYKKKKK